MSNKDVDEKEQRYK